MDLLCLFCPYLGGKRHRQEMKVVHIIKLGLDETQQYITVSS